MPSPDTIATIILGVFTAALLLSMRLIRPADQKPRHGARWLDAHDVPAWARCGPYDVPTEARTPRPALPASTSLSAVETVPDPVVSPFAARTA